MNDLKVKCEFLASCQESLHTALIFFGQCSDCYPLQKSPMGILWETMGSHDNPTGNHGFTMGPMMSPWDTMMFPWGHHGVPWDITGSHEKPMVAMGSHGNTMGLQWWHNGIHLDTMGSHALRKNFYSIPQKITEFYSESAVNCSILQNTQQKSNII